MIERNDLFEMICSTFVLHGIFAPTHLVVDVSHQQQSSCTGCKVSILFSVPNAVDLF